MMYVLLLYLTKIWWLEMNMNLLWNNFDSFEHLQNFLLVIDIVLKSEFTNDQELLEDILHPDDLMDWPDVHESTSLSLEESVLVPWPHLKTHRWKID